MILDAIQRRLALKMLIALILVVAVAMALVIGVAVRAQRQGFLARMTADGHQLTSMAYAGIKHPMAVGDSASVEHQLQGIRDQLQGTDVVICDFRGRIVFATDPDLLGKGIAGFLADPAAVSLVEGLLDPASGRHEVVQESRIGQQPYLVTGRAITNEPECHHCHGRSRRILGALLSRHHTGSTYEAIGALQQRTVFISLGGIVVIVFLVYFLVSRLVTRPVQELAAQADRLARGDLEARVRVASPDVIGDLARSFNTMAVAIRERMEFAAGLENAIADPLFIVDRDMVITTMNRACAELIGCDPAQVVGKRTCREVLGSDICDSDCPVARCYADAGPVAGIRATVTTAAGDKIPIVTSASGLRDASGDIIGAVEIFRDITAVLEAERLRYVQATAEREEHQRRLLEERATGLLAVLDQAAGGDLAARVPVTGDNDLMDRLAVQTNHMLENVQRLYEKIRSFSRELEVEVARRTMMLRERTLLLERANRELRELDRLKSSFLANMSHELRTPMNSIIGYTDLLLDRVDGEINEEQEKSLTKVANNARHLLQLINDILDMSKIEAGKMTLEPREEDIGVLIEEAMAHFRPAVEEKGLVMALDIPPDLPPAVVDRDKFRQIMNNLLSNAVKFTDEGAITVRVRPSTVGVRPEEGGPPLFLEVCVEDTGIGIRQEDMGKLFDKFSQIDVSASRQYEGTGLGLSIARGLVVLHKGMIWAESEFGRGTKIFFTIPADQRVFAKAKEPVVDLQMAEVLAGYFNKPVSLFLQPPTYGGKPVRCWEYSHCGQTSCPAYGVRERRCWLIPGTHCKGVQIAKCPEKAEFCRGCEIIEHLVLGEEEEDTGDGGRTVLAIDDNPEVIDLIAKYLGPAYRVKGVTDSAQAVAEAARLQPAAITLDIMMPGKDGWQVLQELKSDPATRDIPVIVVSIVDDRRRGFSLGAAEYLVKPVRRRELLARLAALERLAEIRKVLVVEEDPASRETLGQLLSEAGWEPILAGDGAAARGAVEREMPDCVVCNLMNRDEAAAIGFVEWLRRRPGGREVPFILLTTAELSDDELRRLNGGVQAILRNTPQAGDEILAEVREVLGRLVTGGEAGTGIEKNEGEEEDDGRN